MSKVNDYLLKSFLGVFSSLFIILFSIASIIFFINIANATSMIQINIIEFLMLYVYLLPKLLIYTIPITFFISLCLTLFNLSKENELIVLFGLGFSPGKLSRFFIVLASLFSTLLIVNIIILVPLSNQLNNNFLDYKKTKAKFNIQGSKFGQKFLNWTVYIDKVEKSKIYKNITLYNRGSAGVSPRLILAEKALTQNIQGTIRLVLKNGKIFEFQKKNIKQVDFKKMYINYKSTPNIRYMQTIYAFWSLAFTDKNRAYEFAFFILIALFPLTMVLTAIGISVTISRYVSSKIYFYQFLSILIYFSLSVIFAKINAIGAISIVSIIALLSSYAIYKRNIALRF